MGLLIAGTELIVVNQDIGQPRQWRDFPVPAEQRIIRRDMGAEKRSQCTICTAWGRIEKRGALRISSRTIRVPGQVLAFAGNGEFLGALVPPDPVAQKFRPRGMVVGPDGLLYVSSDPNFAAAAGPTTGGQVLRFDPDKLVLVSSKQ
jgi:hypothetical protein